MTDSVKTGTSSTAKPAAESGKTAETQRTSDTQGFGGAALWDRLFPFPTQEAAPSIPDAQNMMMTVPHLQAALMKAAIDQQKEFFGFLQQRCDQRMHYAKTIGSAGSVGDVLSASLNFYQEAAMHYADHASRLAEISSQGTIEIAHDLQQEREKMLSLVGKKKLPETRG